MHFQESFWACGPRLQPPIKSASQIEFCELSIVKALYARFRFKQYRIPYFSLYAKRPLHSCLFSATQASFGPINSLSWGLRAGTEVRSRTHPTWPNMFVLVRIMGKVGAPGLWCSAGISPVLGSPDGRGIILIIGYSSLGEYENVLQGKLRFSFVSTSCS